MNLAAAFLTGSSQRMSTLARAITLMACASLAHARPSSPLTQTPEVKYLVVTRHDPDVALVSRLDAGLAPIDGATLSVPGLRQAVYADGKLAVLAEALDQNGNHRAAVTLYDSELEAISAPTRLADPFMMTSSPWKALYFRDGGAKLAVLRMYSDPSSELASTVPYLRTLDCSAPDATEPLSNSTDPLIRLPWGIGHILDVNPVEDELVYTMGLNRDQLHVVNLADNTRRQVVTDLAYRGSSLVGSAAISAGVMMIMANGDVWYLDMNTNKVVGKKLPGYADSDKRVVRGSAALRSDGRPLLVVEEANDDGSSRMAGHDAETLELEWEVASMPPPTGWRLFDDALVGCWWANPGQILLLEDSVAIATQSAAPVEDMIAVE
jgi:hypothetical protein